MREEVCRWCLTGFVYSFISEFAQNPKALDAEEARERSTRGGRMNALKFKSKDKSFNANLWNVNAECGVQGQLDDIAAAF